MVRVWPVSFAAGLLALALTAAPLAVAGERETMAVAEAERWLQLVDSGLYAESWTETAGYFRNAVAQGQWGDSLRAARVPLGVLLFRKVKSATHATTLPGAPDGEYVVIQFESSFENKTAAAETVTPMRDAVASLRDADAALHRAKDAGRNRVAVAG